VAFSALQYDSILAWFLILATTKVTYFPEPPYNFDTIGVGLLNTPLLLELWLEAFGEDRCMIGGSSILQRGVGVFMSHR
jgi:hypothetical protein